MIFLSQWFFKQQIHTNPMGILFARHLTLLSLDQSQLAWHLRRLGLCLCCTTSDAFTRPKRGSMLLLERWSTKSAESSASANRWRILWNGLDVSHHLSCGASGNLGCGEAELLEMLSSDSHSWNVVFWQSFQGIKKRKQVTSSARASQCWLFAVGLVYMGLFAQKQHVKQLKEPA